MDGLSDNMTMPINLKAKVVVAAHDKDINSVVVAPNDSLVCSGSQVGNYIWLAAFFGLLNQVILLFAEKRTATLVVCFLFSSGFQVKKE